METRLRQRVIGGIVLAALAVIFLPLFFKESTSNPSSQQASVTEQIPAPPPAPNGSATTVVQMTDPGASSVNSDEAKQKADANLAANTNSQVSNDSNAPGKPRQANDSLPVAKNATVYDQDTQANNTTTTDQTVAPPQTASSTSAPQVREEQAFESSTKAAPAAVFDDVMPEKKKHTVQKSHLSPKQRIAALDDQENLNKLQTEQSVADETSKEVEKAMQKAGKVVVAKTTNEKGTTVVAQNNEEDVISKNMNAAEEKILSTQKSSKEGAAAVNKKESPRPAIHEVLKNPKGSAWVVQLGCFSDVANAKALASQLQTKGFSAYLQKVKTAKGGNMTRVLIGPETERNKAETVLAKLDQQLKLKGVIVPFDAQQIK